MGFAAGEKVEAQGDGISIQAWWLVELGDELFYLHMTSVWCRGAVSTRRVPKRLSFGLEKRKQIYFRFGDMSISGSLWIWKNKDFTLVARHIALYLIWIDGLNVH